MDSIAREERGTTILVIHRTTS